MFPRQKITAVTMMWLTFMALFFLGCSNNENKLSGKFTIHGKLKNTNSDKIILSALKVDSLNVMDSTIINENGEFTFSCKTKEISFYLLQLSKDNFITLLINEGEQVEITGNARQLAKEYQVSGSPGSELLWQLNEFTRKNYHKADSLLKVQIQYKDSNNFFQLKTLHDSLYKEIFNNQHKHVQRFIKDNPHSLASLIALYQIFGQQKILNERDHFNYFKLLDSTLSPIYTNNGYVLELHERVKNIENFKSEIAKNLSKLDSGMMAPDIRIKNIGGNIQPLSSFKGRPMLVFFWAGASDNCTDIIAEFKWIHKTYRTKGFEIYAVSLDNNRYAWENAVRQNKINWVHVGDMLGWDSPVVKDYAVDYIPLAVLIDKYGNIVKRGITHQELLKWLSKTYRIKSDTFTHITN